MQYCFPDVTVYSFLCVISGFIPEACTQRHETERETVEDIPVDTVVSQGQWMGKG